MKKLAIGLTVLAAILMIIILSQQDKIKKIWEIKLGTSASEQPQTSDSDKRIDEIIAISRKNQTDQEEASRRIGEFTKKFLIRCSDLADTQQCENLMLKIAKDEKIILALEKLNKAGVKIIITWYKPDINLAVYINEYGSLMIHEETDIKDIRKFFGLN